jgi:hypothetical protein
MAVTPEPDSSLDQDLAAPLWLESTVRPGEVQERGEDSLGKEGEDAVQPLWLGSVVRRDGSQTSGAGWVEPEHAERPRWVGSVARRGDQTQATEKGEPGDDSVHSLYLVDLESENEVTNDEQAERESSADWQGSGGRARLNEAREVEPEAVLEPFASGDELGERRTRYVVGALGMSLRVVA